MVLPSLGPGGSEGVVSTIASRWAERGWSITVISLEAAETAPYYPLSSRVVLRRLGVPVDKNGILRGTYKAANRLRLLRSEFLRLKPHLVVSFLTRTNILSVLAAAGSGIPVVVSERNNPEAQTFGPIWSRLRRLTYPHAFGLVTMTHGAMESFPPKQRRRSWVIPNQVNVPSDIVPKRSGRIIAAVGRLVPQKGFDLLLEAFGQVAPYHPKWSLTIWGEGPERINLTMLRDELGLSDRVRFAGVSERPGSWLETADVFVLSSRYEGWGIVLMEAMAAGLPVVSFDCKFGPREMISHGEDGLLVPAGNVTALAASLSHLLGDESLRRNLGMQAALSAKRFSSDTVMSAWDKVVDDAVRSRGLSWTAPQRRAVDQIETDDPDRRHHHMR
ncbi:glycosyltransferase family 4 protein [Rhodoligotrophos appendicifer]|uniref:glycosyltransferase family 4 protein n=1 Tax=Rhodoligotrophos appendicifer TaxID=987056 RepID=UPI001FE42B8E|nr:glycosyltransferase family 4 protein [Rhodoligotrophos appendicifer]